MMQKCLECNNTFTPKRKGQIYCSPKCQQAYNRHRAKSPYKKFVCRECNKTVIIPSTEKIKAFCSDECRADYWCRYQAKETVLLDIVKKNKKALEDKRQQQIRRQVSIMAANRAMKAQESQNSTHKAKKSNKSKNGWYGYSTYIEWYINEKQKKKQ